MTMPADKPVTQLLAAAGQGDTAARERLWGLIYAELHELAGKQMAREAPGRTLQPTALVHEAYMRLFGREQGAYANRRHFFAAAARAMRRIRIDDARKRKRMKRDGGQQPVPGLERSAAVLEPDPAEVLALDEALARLEETHPRMAEVVSLRYYAGLSVDDTAEAIGVSPRTVDSDWQFARAWLHRALKDE